MAVEKDHDGGEDEAPWASEAEAKTVEVMAPSDNRQDTQENQCLFAYAPATSREERFGRQGFHLRKTDLSSMS